VARSLFFKDILAGFLKNLLYNTDIGIIRYYWIMLDKRKIVTMFDIYNSRLEIFGDADA